MSLNPKFKNKRLFTRKSFFGLNDIESEPPQKKHKTSDLNHNSNTNNLQIDVDESRSNNNNNNNPLINFTKTNYSNSTMNTNDNGLSPLSSASSYVFYVK